jgi:hypothetical protein
MPRTFLLIGITATMRLSNNYKNLVCNNDFFDIVHRLYFNKITTFRELDLLPSDLRSEANSTRGPNS